jgi:hypothetical protein
MIFFLSCEEKEVEPYYKAIPAKFDWVFKDLRSLTDTTVIEVISSDGLNDELVLSNYDKEKKYFQMLTKTEVPGAEKQEIYLEYSYLEFNPALYQFYNIKYSIDFLDRRDIATNAENPEDYYAKITIQNKILFKYSLLKSTFITEYNYEVLNNYMVNGFTYDTVYRFDINDAFGMNGIRKVYLSLEKGVLQFETNSNVIYNVNL